MSDRRQSNRRMPAEWEPHAATLLQWPSAEGASFPGEWTPRIESVFVELIEVITRFEAVELCVWDEAEATRVGELLSAAARQQTRIHAIPTREPWCRDIGPTFVIDSDRIVAVKWRFNGWGDQWPSKLEDEAGRQMAAAMDVEIDAVDLVFEGGGVESNGAGSLMVTEECVLDPMRNPGMSRQQAEGILCRKLGAHQLLWLRGGVAGDDTGHTDVVARFVSEDTVVATRAADPAHPDFGLLEDNLKRISSAFKVITLPALNLEYNNEIEDFLPKGYANFYVFNECVIVPAFGVPEDAEAVATLRALFADREIAAIDCNDLVFGQGSIHCLTQQIPALPA